MKKLFYILLGAVSFSCATPNWSTTQFRIKQIWVVPGPTPVVSITTDEAIQTGLPYANNIYGFYLNESSGNEEMLRLAQAAYAGNLPINIYCDRQWGEISNFSTGATSPMVESVNRIRKLLTMTVNR